MKRNEVVSYLADLIETIRYEDVMNGDNKGHAEEYASFILHKLERKDIINKETAYEAE